MTDIKSKRKYFLRVAIKACFFLYSVLISFSSYANENNKVIRSPAKPNGVKPVLISAPEVVDKLNKLGENEIVLLPQAKVIGEFNDVAIKYGLDKNGPGIRDYCLKMVWAEDRKRALYCGGNHGVPHGLNDIWEYDLASNTWAMLWAPEDFTRKPWGKWEDAVIKDGVLQSKKGATVQASHTWDQMTYDPEIGALVWLTAWNIEEHLGKQGLSEKLKTENRHKIPLWGYYPSLNTWKPLGVDEKITQSNNASLLCYIPELNGTIYYGKGASYKTFLWNNDTDKWSQIAASQIDKGQSPGDEMLSCYDIKNKMMVAVRSGDKGGGTYHFDTNQKTWSLAVAYEAGKMPKAYDFNAVIGNDPSTGDCILFTNDKESFGFWSYNSVTKKWALLTPKGEMPLVDEKGRGYNGYFDMERCVFVLFKNASREVRVYRYKKAQ